jgi:hypothetical protein
MLHLHNELLNVFPFRPTLAIAASGFNVKDFCGDISGSSMGCSGVALDTAGACSSVEFLETLVEVLLLGTLLLRVASSDASFPCLELVIAVLKHAGGLAQNGEDTVIILKTLCRRLPASRVTL